MLALTITTCKRIDLFLKTIRSFTENCLDLHSITTIIHYDDSSNPEDRKRMYNELLFLFPNVIIYNVYFNNEDIKSNRRHLEIMKIWKSQVMLFDYVFHLEDDWLFVKKFNLQEGIDLLKNNPDVALVGYSWERKIFPSNLFVPKQIGNFWEWFYSDKFVINEPLFIDETEMKYLPENHWVKYINWPYFGFRPGIHDIKKINQLENFNDSMSSFELEFAIRFSKNFKSFLHNDRICYHIGQESAYDINNSNR